MSAPVLVARDVVAFRGSRRVLAGASLAVSPGEVVALIGPNGAGKSTLLGALAGDVPIASGEASIGGLPSATRDLVAMARRRAVVRQDTRVVSDLTAREVVSLGRAPHGDGARPGGIAIVRAALAAVGIEAAADRIVPQLSGGEQQRVHLARALAQVAGRSLGGAGSAGAALLLDEPASALDLAHAIATLDLLRRLARDGLAVLVVLHDLDHAARVADRVGVLDAGRCVAVGTPREVLRPALLGEVFGVRTRVVDAPWDERRPWVGIEGPSEPARPAPPVGVEGTETPTSGTGSAPGC